MTPEERRQPWKSWTLRGGPGRDYPCADANIIECASSECQHLGRCRRGAGNAEIFHLPEGKTWNDVKWGTLFLAFKDGTFDSLDYDPQDGADSRIPESSAHQRG